MTTITADIILSVVWVTYTFTYSYIRGGQNFTDANKKQSKQKHDSLGTPLNKRLYSPLQE